MTLKKSSSVALDMTLTFERKKNHVCASVRHCTTLNNNKKDCPKKSERCSACGKVGHLKVTRVWVWVFGRRKK